MGESYAGLLYELAIYAGVLDQKGIEEIMNKGVIPSAVSVEEKIATTWSTIKKQ